MSDDKEKGPAIIEAYRDLIDHMEQSAGRIRLLSAITVIVAAVLVVSYLSQLILPLTGTTSATVNLTDPAIVASELIVLGLVLIWLYLGISDLRFSSRVKRDILNARTKETAINERVSSGDPPGGSIVDSD